MNKAIPHEEIEKAAEKFADGLRVSSAIPGALVPILHAIAKSSYIYGAQDFIGKQEKGAEDTVIQGWVARDQDGYISLFKDKPTRDTCDKDDIPYGFWDEADSNHIELPITSFPDLTWESDPQEVEIIIKRKKKNL